MLKWFPYNMSFAERAIRVAIGLFVLTYIAWGQVTSLAQTIDPNWGLVGLYPFITGIMGSEPIYTLLHLTFRKPKLTLTEWDLAKAPKDARAAERLDALNVTERRSPPQPAA